MKKIHSILALTLLLTGSLQAQLTLLWTDAMNYPLGPVHQGHWSSWSGNPGSQDLVMVNNGPWQMDSQVGYIGNDGQDAMLKLGNLTSGSYLLTCFLSIPADKSAYFNIQEDEDPMGTGAWGVEVFFNQTGNTPGEGQIYDDDQNLLATFSYPNSGGVIFFKVDFDVDEDSITLYELDGSGNIAYEGPMYTNGGNLGGINFFRAIENTEFFLDQFQFWATSTLNTDEELNEGAFNYYPNPVNDVLNFTSDKEIDAIAIYDLTGKLIRSEKPLSVAPSLDTKDLVQGMYLAKVKIGNGSRTIRFIKQ